VVDIGRWVVCRLYFVLVGLLGSHACVSNVVECNFLYIIGFTWLPGFVMFDCGFLCTWLSIGLIILLLLQDGGLVEKLYTEIVYLECAWGVEFV
jgi:hypothetical protein